MDHDPEKLTDIPQPGSAQQRVHDGVGEHISIGMPQESPVERDFRPAQNELPPRCQAVYVIAVPNPKCIHTNSPLPLRIPSPKSRSVGVVSFILARSRG